MKRISFILIAFITTISCFGQEWVFDQIAEESRDSGSMKFGEIITLIVVFGIALLLYKLFSTYSAEQKRKKQFILEQQNQERIKIKKTGSFICPICGSVLSSEDFEKVMVSSNNEKFYAKYCKDCAKEYNLYEKEHKDWQRHHINDIDGLPTWFAGMMFALMVLTDVGWIIYHIVIGKFDYFIGRIILSPIVIGFIMMGIGYIYVYLLQIPEPAPPFKCPTKNHTKECNALIG